MNIESLIRNKRVLEYAIEKNDDKEAEILLNNLIKQYYSSLEIDEKEIYYDGGYYRYHNMDLCISSKNKAEFRVLICLKNKKQIILLKNNNINWDETILDKSINIVGPFKQDIDKIPTNILQPYIDNLVEKFHKHEKCNHLEFLDNGYYKYENHKIQKSDRSKADFRIITCDCCQKQYFISKSENPYWDVILNDRTIKIFTNKEIGNQKVFCQYSYKTI